MCPWTAAHQNKTFPLAVEVPNIHFQCKQGQQVTPLSHSDCFPACFATNTGTVLLLTVQYDIVKSQSFSVTSCPLWPQKLVRIDLALCEISFCVIRIKQSLQLPVAPSAIAPCIMPSVSNRFRIKILTDPHPRPPLRAPLPSQALSGHPKGNRLPCALVDGANWPCPFQRTPELYDNC